MNPLFLILFFLVAVLVLTLVVFLVAVLFQPREWALRSAVVFVGGVVGGVALSGILSLLVVGGAALFNTSFEVFVYLVSLAVGGFIGGCVSIGLFIKANQRNPLFKRDWLKLTT